LSGGLIVVVVLQASQKFFHPRWQGLVTRCEHLPKSSLEGGAYRLADVELVLLNALHS
jgi:hypothetical protein